MSTLLHIGPLVSSTVTLWFSLDQQMFLSIFLNKKVEPQSKDILTPYWQVFFDGGLYRVIAPLVVTMGTCGTIIATNKDIVSAKGSYPWYIASALLAAGHFAFVPAIAPKIRALQSGGSTGVLRQWLDIHFLRTSSVDLLAWTACMIASVRTLTV